MAMSSKECVRAALSHKTPDKLPANFECVSSVMENLMKRYNFSTPEQVYQKFDIDIRSIGPDYIGPELKSWKEPNGDILSETMWGSVSRRHWTGKEYNSITESYPLDDAETLADIENHLWPSPDWFDYESIKYKCEKFKDKALIMGHPGPFQVATTSLMSMDNLFVHMALNPEIAHRVYDKMVEFELEYYERILQAADGQIDILRPHDDYGTQILSLIHI